MVDTTTFSMTQILAGSITIGVLVAGTIAWTVGGMRDEMTSIRQNLGSLQSSDKNNALAVRDSETKLIGELSSLRTAIATMSGRMEGYTNSVAALSSRLDDFQRQLNARQNASKDPKVREMFFRELKDAGLGDRQVIIVPYDLLPAMQPSPDPGPQPPKPDTPPTNPGNLQRAPDFAPMPFQR